MYIISPAKPITCYTRIASSSRVHKTNSSQCELTRKGSLAHLLTFSMVSLKLLKMILYMEKANIICPNPYQNSH